MPAILINKDQVASEQPRLPDSVKAVYAGRVVMGAYKVCISENGTIDSVKPVNAIVGADERIMETVKLWRYKPQPAPVCFIQSFEFHIDAPTAAAGEEAAVSQALADATLALTSGKPQQAMELARPLALRGGAAADEAWRIVGIAACLTKNPREASASYGTARTRASLDLLIEVCRRSGLTLQAGRFVGQPAAK